MSVNPVPEGYKLITPMISTDRPEEVVTFLSGLFPAKELMRVQRTDGSIMAVDMTVGDVSLTVMGSSADMPAARSVFYSYVPDCDAVYEKALGLGALSLQKPQDMPHGDRMGGVRDPGGNDWWIATRIKNLSREEMEKQMQAMERQDDYKGEIC